MLTEEKLLNIIISFMKQLSREEVYSIIDGERAYQDNLWGGEAHDNYKSVGDFIVYMDRYMTKAKEAYTTKAGNAAALDQLRKVAALSVACFEYNGVPKR